jgi:hypothetical protein
MKRSELLLKLQRYYTQKHCMVEQRYITYQQFMDEVLQLVEELGMLPPPYTCINPSQPAPTPVGSCKLHKWEPE